MADQRVVIARQNDLLKRQELMLAMQRAQLEHLTAMANGWAMALGMGMPDVTDEELREALKEFNAQAGAELAVVP